jgi:hypothetical protein
METKAEGGKERMIRKGRITIYFLHYKDMLVVSLAVPLIALLKQFHFLFV